MPLLGPTIRTIRKRLGKTMVEFAEMIGCKQSTVSRYESGKLLPGRSVLILLLQRARGSERQPVLDALGVTGTESAGWSEHRLLTALKPFEDHLAVSGSVRRHDPTRASLASFASIAKRIMCAGRRVDPALVSILQQWTAHHSTPKAAAHFEHVAAYLKVQLRMLAARSQRRRKPARSG